MSVFYFDSLVSDDKNSVALMTLLEMIVAEGFELKR